MKFMSLAVGVLLLCTFADATTYSASCTSTVCTYSFDSKPAYGTGPELSATAVFTYTGGNTMTVTVTNTGNDNGSGPYSTTQQEFLAAIAFGDKGPGGYLSALSASKTVSADTAIASTTVETASGSTTSTSSQCNNGTDVSGCYAFDNGSNFGYTVGSNTFRAGISSVGYARPITSCPGGPNMGSFFMACDDSNFSPSGGPDISTVYNGLLFAPTDLVTYGSNLQKLGSEPFAVNSVTFTLSVASGFNLSQIGDLDFIYGAEDVTKTSAPLNFETPEPGYYGALALAMGGLIWAVRRKNRRVPDAQV